MEELANEVVEGVFDEQDEPIEAGEAETQQASLQRPERELITLDTPLPELPAVRLPQPDELQHENYTVTQTKIYEYDINITK